MMRGRDVLVQLTFVFESLFTLWTLLFDLCWFGIVCTHIDMELDASDDEPLADFVFRFISSSTGGGQQVALLFTGHRLLALNLQRQTLVTRVAQTKEELFGY